MPDSYLDAKLAGKLEVNHSEHAERYYLARLQPDRTIRTKHQRVFDLVSNEPKEWYSKWSDVV